MARSKESVLKWIEGSIVSYLYGGISSDVLVARIQKVRAQYGVSREETLRIVESIETKHVTYFGGRYRLAFALMGKKPAVAPFNEQSERAKLIASLKAAISKA